MNSEQHYRAFYITTAWTLGLLFLGSVVHATGSSLACPDWPTCFGTFVPEMTGGVFWEHLHRLVAGGLVLIFSGATYMAWRPEARRPAIRRWALLGIGLLLVQSLFGGLTVLMRLPDAVSTTHLALAFLFLALVTGLTVVTSPGWIRGSGAGGPLRGLRTLAVSAAVLTFLQSVLGAAVRHMDAGLVCPDVPLCLGQWIPPLQTASVAVHFSHRVTGLLLLITVLALTVRAVRSLEPSGARTLASSAGVLVTLQVLLGFVSVYTRLAVLPVSFHTLLAAGVLTLTVGVAVMTWAPGEGSRAPSESSGLGAVGRGALGTITGVITLVLGFAAPLAAQDRTPPVPTDSVLALPELRVEIGRLRTGSVPVAEVPFPVQIIGGSDVRGRTGSSVAGALTGSAGLSLTNQTGSPSQADIRLRGFALSPIVGVPQGVSVFVDGVRVNEADASQVHLSLIPGGAVDRIELIRGSVGAFGRNSLAGALNIVTRRGSERSLEMEIEGGSFGLFRGTAMASESVGRFDGLVTASYDRSNGWRQLSSTVERSLFAKIGGRGERTDGWLSYSFASHRLEGPGPLPESWLDGGALPPDITDPPDDRRKLQYTGGSGDRFVPRLHFLSGRLERRLSDGWTLQANAYGRLVDFRQSNDNITEPNALGLTDIRTLGSTAQVSYEPTDRLTATAGAEWTRNDVEIEIRELPNPQFPITPATTENLETDENNVGVFGEVWWKARPTVSLYGSLRFDYVKLPVRDILDPSGSGLNQFKQFSGGLGLSKALDGSWNAFASYGRGFRAPVILEVMCADPDDPCQLPFELGPDPPLKPVISDTWQVGLRMIKIRSQAEVAVYWSEVRDDIFNVTDLATPTRGFFTNLDRTRRVGLEASLALVPFSSLPSLTVRTAMGWTRATFESEATLSAAFFDDDEAGGPGDPAGGGDPAPPQVEPGDRFPMVPSLTASLGLQYDLSDTVFELTGAWVGGQFLVGDEGNDATLGKLDGYALLHVSVERNFGAAVLYLRVANLLDADYRAFGILSENLRGPTRQVERFLTPGYPRHLTAGMRIRMRP